jgi:hypothetical protein
MAPPLWPLSVLNAGMDAFYKRQADAVSRYVLKPSGLDVLNVGRQYLTCDNTGHSTAVDKTLADERRVCARDIVLKI